MPRVSLLLLLCTLAPSAALANGDPPDPTTQPPGDYCTTITAIQALYMRPIQLSSLSTARATTRRPTLTWWSCAAARVEVCADSSCTTVLSTADVTGTRSWTPSSDLTGNGNVYYWRVKNLIGTTLGASSKVWEVQVPAESAAFSTSGGSVLDYNLDGRADLAVGAYDALTGRGVESGVVYIYAAGGRRGASPIQTLQQASPQDGSLFGAAVSNAGDVNGDGFGDLLVGANNADNPSNVATGAAYVFFGTATGFDPIPSELYGSVDSAFGYTVSGAGDVNGDGAGDFLVGAPAYGVDNAGEAYLYYGRRGTTPTFAAPAATLTGTGGLGTEFGVNVAGVGDLDGDGYGDIAVGESYFTFWSGSHPAGKVFVWYGGPNGISGPGQELVSPDSANGDGFGYSISDAGDLDGDGYFDLVVGASGTNSHDGAVYVWYGGPGGLSSLGADLTLDPVPGNQGFFGYSVSAAGDIDGDGIDDLVVGETDGDNLDGNLQVYLSTAGSPTKVANPDPTDGYLGNQVLIAGDADNDGLAEFLAGGSGAGWLFPSTGAAPLPADGIALGPTSAGFGIVGR